MSARPDVERPRRFLVTWRDGQEPAGIHPVGCLAFDGRYSFAYLRGAATAQGFRPFPGFPDLERIYRSPSLFLFFADRVMDRRRPEYPTYVRALDLPVDSSELDLLSRNEGVGKGDRVTVTEEPIVQEYGRTSHVFVVRGLRFAAPDLERREGVLAELEPGTPLLVRPDTSNVVNPAALQLLTTGGDAIGWVPDALVPYVRAVLAHPGGDVIVQRRNGPELPPHVRLLASVRGTLPDGVRALPQLAEAPELTAV